MKDNTKAVLLALLCTAIVSVAQILLKLGSDKFSIASIDAILLQFTNIHLIIGGILYVGGAFVLIKAFKLGELSVVYPVMASSYISVSILSSIFLNEIITGQKWIGLGLITLGVVFIGVGGDK